MSNPLKSAVQEMVADNCYSPDMADLQSQYQFVPLFVFGNEKLGFSEHFRLRDWPRVGVGVTHDRTFLMFRNNQWHEPIVLNRPAAATARSIAGEVYLVTPEIIFDLDAVMERGAYFKRWRRKIDHYDPSDQKKKWFQVDAFMYMGVSDYWNDQIKAGDLPLLTTSTAMHLNNSSVFLWMMNDDAPNQERIKKMKEAQAKSKPTNHLGEPAELPWEGMNAFRS